MYKAENSVRVAYPKDFKGIKVSYAYEEFGTPNLN